VLFGRRGPVSTDEDRISAFAAFGGTQVASHSHHFEGGNIGAIFGGAELDLTDAALAEHSSLDVFTAFGGTEITVPEGWKVVTHSLPLFGGVDNITTKEHLPPDAPTLDISATVLFGGIEVKH
jgi:predicted membrane protein